APRPGRLAGRTRLRRRRGGRRDGARPSARPPPGAVRPGRADRPPDPSSGRRRGLLGLHRRPPGRDPPPSRRALAGGGGAVPDFGMNHYTYPFRDLAPDYARAAAGFAVTAG